MYLYVIRFYLFYRKKNPSSRKNFVRTQKQIIWKLFFFFLVSYIFLKQNDCIVLISVFVLGYGRFISFSSYFYVLNHQTRKRK